MEESLQGPSPLVLYLLGFFLALKAQVKSQLCDAFLSLTSLHLVLPEWDLLSDRLYRTLETLFHLKPLRFTAIEAQRIGYTDQGHIAND